MTEDRIGREVTNGRLLRLVSEPTRLKATSILTERAASASEIAEELGMSVEDAARCLEGLLADGLVEVVGEVLRGGAVEPSYRAVVELIWNEEAYELLGATGRRQLSAWLVATIEADVKEALDCGYFDVHSDAHTSRTICMVDERGWIELNRIMGDALDAILAVREECAERLAERREVGMPALAAMICTELPPRSGRTD